MTYQEIKKALKNNRTLIWEDPIPIEGNDYTIQKIWDYANEETAMIQYGNINDSFLSEAHVFLSEIKLKKLDKKEFQKRVENLIEEIEDVILEISCTGGVETEIQRYYIINHLNQLKYAVNTVKKCDFELIF